MIHIPNLPLRFQNSFEKAKANAELAYATRGDKFPHHPHFSESGLHLPLLMHTVFFAYCEQARDALKNGDWTLAELRRATEAAWLPIFDFYLFRERGSCSEEQKATYRTAVWRTVTDDMRWKQHLLEVATFRGQEDVESREEPAKASEFPDLGADANERIELAWREAHDLTGGPGAVGKDSAMGHYLDVVAWEYISTKSVPEFEAIVKVVAETARTAFGCESEAADTRTRHWIAEARERSTNGIVSDTIPVKIDFKQANCYRELEVQFRSLPGADQDLQVMFADGGKSEICRGPNDPALFDSLQRRFEQLARRAMAAMGFTFGDPSRTVFYWYELLKQNSPHFKGWRISRLCFASADFCTELETRCLEAGTVRPIDRDRPSMPEASPVGSTVESITDEAVRRQQLLADYKTATGQPSNQRIYSAKNSGIHKPQFYEWLRAELLASSQTTINFERFLAEKKPPIPKKPTK